MQSQRIDEQAITQLYVAYYEPVLRLLARMTRNTALAEDLTQDTFLKVLRHESQIKDVVSARAWLFRIATRTAYDYFRRQRHCPTTPLTDEHAERLGRDGAEAQLGEIEQILAVLHKLPAHYQVPLLLHSVAGYPLDAIAARLGWKVGTVKSRLHRARAQFRAHYPGHEVVDDALGIAQYRLVALAR